MVKDYSIKGTTKVQREKIVADALALSMLGAQAPSEWAMSIMRRYIDGECEIAEVKEQILEHYRSIAHE